MYRDWVILLTTRWLFKQVVFHFHAAGLTELLPEMNRFARFLFRLAYGRPNCAIHLADAEPQDGQRLNALHSVVVPYGSEDAFPQYRAIRHQGANSESRILFVGALRESKGVMVLLEACVALRQRGLAFRLELMGDFNCVEFEAQVRNVIGSRDLQSQVHLLGVCRDEAKWQAYAKADIFCFPSFYECENLPVVIIEAMQFGLPVVATRWRGIPALVEDEQQGLLVSTHSPEEVADRLARLIVDPELRRRLGRSGRERYLREFTLRKWTDSMARVFSDLETCPSGSA
jgi:glycosyltransferase involved in cell wall biosynthesis